MKKLQTKRTIVVEGRYDAIKVDALIEANIITIDGFAIYSDKAKQTLLKQLAQKEGVLLLLDADGAGFRMRHYITNIVGEANVLQVYTPSQKGKESRKSTPGKEGLLGVEGIDSTVLYDILSTALSKDSGKPHINKQSKNKKSEIRSAAPTETENMHASQEDSPDDRTVTYTDLFRWGFSGTAGSVARKNEFLTALGLPLRLSKKELINVLNQLYTYQELEAKKQAMFGE